MFKWGCVNIPGDERESVKIVFKIDNKPGEEINERREDVGTCDRV